VWVKPYWFATNQEVFQMAPTDIIIPSEVFIFTGQSTIDTWPLKNRFSDMGWAAYDQWMADEFILSMQKIKELADGFPFWQRIRDTGRPPIKERDLLIAFLLRHSLTQHSDI